jgi:4-hydroxybenzoate polyprenyltransferase
MVINLFKTLRPQHWIKNLAVLAPAFFAGQITSPANFDKLLWAFIILSLASSGGYIVNDLVDRAKDKLHPVKARRPIASGKIPEGWAVFMAVALLTASFLLSLRFPPYFGLTIAAFITLQLAYSLLLKRIILIDVMAIAATFSLRVFAGALILPISLSAWLILTTISLSLLIAIGKRRGEVTLLSHRLAAKHRDVVSHYPNVLLDGLTFMMAGATLLTYAFFTFNQPELNTRRTILQLLPETLASPKWLMATIPLVIYGIFRYLYVIYEKKEGSSPERVLIRDGPLLLTVVGWVLASYIILYVITR